MGFDCSENLPSFFFPICAFSVLCFYDHTAFFVKHNKRDSSGKQTSESVLGVLSDGLHVSERMEGIRRRLSTFISKVSFFKLNVSWY